MKHMNILSRFAPVMMVIFFMSLSVSPVLALGAVTPAVTPAVTGDLALSQAVGGWQTETIDGTIGVGQYTSMVYDKNGVPHVSYFDRTHKQIMYATKPGNTWIHEIVAYPTWIGSYFSFDGSETETISIAIDPSGQPGICFHEGINDGTKLWYAHRNELGWEIEEVSWHEEGHSDKLSKATSLAYDPSGIPHISFSRKPWLSSADLMYATRDGGTWKSVIVDSDGNTGWDSSLVIDQSGQAHIAYRLGETSSKLMYAVQDRSGSWRTTRVDILPNTGHTPSIALDSLGKPHISYYNLNQHSLMYATLNGTEWITEIADAGQGAVGAHSSLAFGPHDQPFISYHDASRNLVRFATKIPGSAVWTKQFASLESSGKFSSLAVNPSGNPAIAYYDTYNRILKFSVWTS